MKKNILDRYDRDQNGAVVINIYAKKISHLFNDFDRQSSFSKKDLDEELVEYIIECVNEIGSEDFIIKFYFGEKLNSELVNRVKNSIVNFFEYLQELEKKAMKEQIKNALIFMAIGAFFTAVSFTFSKTNDDENMIYEVISEGLLVAGWVSLWESLATFLIKWLPLSKKLKIYKRIAVAKVEFD